MSRQRRKTTSTKTRRRERPLIYGLTRRQLIANNAAWFMENGEAKTWKQAREMAAEYVHGYEPVALLTEVRPSWLGRKS